MLQAVVNNAGVIRDKSFKGANIKDWDQVTDVGLFTYACLAATL